MKLIGILCWYDERPAALAGVVAGLAKAGVSHVVAADGAYALFPDGRSRSPREQHAVIAEVCGALDIGCTLFAPQEPFAGNEVEKRTVSLRLAETVAVPFEDWYFVVDADHVVTSAIGHMDRLASAEDDVADVRFLNPGAFGGCPLRCVFRAIPGLRYEGNHYTIVAPDGRNLLDHQEPAVDLACLEVEHRIGDRDQFRRGLQMSYYERRDRVGAEKVPVAA